MKTASSKKNVLITFARSFLTLELARHFHAAGHRVFVTDSLGVHVTRFSNAITQFFKVPSPRFHPDQYINALIDIVKEQQIDLLIPIYEEISYIAKAQDCFPDFCQLFCPPFDLYNTLQNKWFFHCKLEQLGIKSPKTLLIRTQKELDDITITSPVALKACYTRASQTIKKLTIDHRNFELPIEPHNPWIMQEWLDGARFCTYSIAHQGKLYAHGTYPVTYAIDGNSCVIFETAEHAGIRQWVENFVAKIGFTGQIAFDFIEKEGVLYAIECNPRATSGLLLFSANTHLDRAFFKQSKAVITPEPQARQQIAAGMLLYGWRKSALPDNRFLQFLKVLCTTKDVVLRANDLKPFLFEPLGFIAIWLNSKKYGLSIPTAFTYDHDWNGEPILLNHTGCAAEQQPSLTKYF